MKRQELRACFDRIQPREELIRSTIVQVNAAREGKRPARATSGYSFVMRLASAACALLLLIGLAFTLDRDVITSPEVLPTPSERVSPMTADAMDGVKEPREVVSGGALVGCEEMLATAQAFGTDFAVCTVVVDAVYFKSESEGFATLRPITIADGCSSTWLSDGTQAVIAAFDASDAALRSMVDLMGSEVLVGLHTEMRDGETVWVIHELHTQVSAVE